MFNLILKWGFNFILTTVHAPFQTTRKHLSNSLNILKLLFSIQKVTKTTHNKYPKKHSPSITLTPKLIPLPSLQDFRSFRLQRQLRRKEMKRLHCTLNNLRTKRSFFEEQINYYNQYVRICLDRQAAKAK